MLEASFIAPLHTNDGDDTTTAQMVAEAGLLHTFGGFTRETGLTGAWRDPKTGATFHDESARYIVAADWTKEARDKLRAIAGRFAYMAAQEAVYLRTDSGAVEFIGPAPEAPRMTGAN